MFVHRVHQQEPPQTEKNDQNSHLFKMFTIFQLLSSFLQGKGMHSPEFQDSRFVENLILNKTSPGRALRNWLNCCSAHFSKRLKITQKLTSGACYSCFPYPNQLLEMNTRIYVKFYVRKHVNQTIISKDVKKERFQKVSDKQFCQILKKKLIISETRG